MQNARTTWPQGQGWNWAIAPKHIGVKDLPTDMQGVFAEQTYDLILFNDIGLHAWTPGRIPEGQYEPLMRAHLANWKSTPDTP